MFEIGQEYKVNYKSKYESAGRVVIEHIELYEEPIEDVWNKGNTFERIGGYTIGKITIKFLDTKFYNGKSKTFELYKYTDEGKLVIEAETKCYKWIWEKDIVKQ